VKTFVFRILVFVVVPLLVAETGLRAWHRDDGWYSKVIREAGRQRLDIIVVGSSRVAAAVKADALAAECSRTLGRPVRAVNMGRGYSTVAEHYLALRALYTSSPAMGPELLILIEAPAGVGSSDSWHESWVSEDRPDFIVPYVRWSDVPAFVAESSTPRDQKIMITLLKASQAYRAFWQLRNALLANGELLVDRMFTGQSPASDALSTAGGVRTDAAGMEIARQLAIRMAEDATKNQKPVSDWNQTILAELVRMVQGRGGRVAFFVMPLSSVQQKPLQTPVRMRDRDEFTRVAATWGAPVIDVPLRVSDEDFPDYWHLRRSRSAEFSRELASGLTRAGVMAPAQSLTRDGAPPKPSGASAQP
jgi:hypothetical protein